MSHRPVLGPFLAGLLLAVPVHAAGSPTLVEREPGVKPGLSARVERAVAELRPLRAQLPLPERQSTTVQEDARRHRERAIRLALERAIERESEAAFDQCVREAASVMSDATVLLAQTGAFSLLRDLHLQMGACLALGPRPADSRIHFVAATLLDETPPRAGLHRTEAEQLQATARNEVLARRRGPVRIESHPPGASVWIDGRRVAGKTPVTVEVRSGDHFVTLRRFRFEPHTERVMLQPSGRVRVSLESASRSTLREQVSRARSVDPSELRLARAAWSRAEQLLVLSPSKARAGGVQLDLLDVQTGRRLRGSTVGAAADARSTRAAVCRVLGEQCAPPRRGIPWYVWPIGGAAVAGGVVTTVIVVRQNRDVRFCPAGGCR